MKPKTKNRKLLKMEICMEFAQGEMAGVELVIPAI